MKHFHDLTIEIDNSKTNLKTYQFKIDKGIITWAGMYFPSGCFGLASGRMMFQAHQILPRNQESWAHGDDGWWQGTMEFPVTAEPLVIKCEGYNVDERYEHTITFALEIMPFTTKARWDELINQGKKLLKMVGV